MNLSSSNNKFKSSVEIMLVGGLGNILFQLNLIYLMNTSKQIKKEFKANGFFLEKVNFLRNILI